MGISVRMFSESLAKMKRRSSQGTVLSFLLLWVSGIQCAWACKTFVHNILGLPTNPKNSLAACTSLACHPIDMPGMSKDISESLIFMLPALSLSLHWAVSRLMWWLHLDAAVIIRNDYRFEASAVFHFWPFSYLSFKTEDCLSNVLLVLSQYPQCSLFFLSFFEWI